MKILECVKFTITIDALAIRISNNRECVIIPHDLASEISLATAMAVAERLLEGDFKITDIKINNKKLEVEYNRELGEYLLISR